MSQQTQLRKSIQQILTEHSDDLTNGTIKFMDALSKSAIDAFGDTFAHFNKTEVISNSGAQSLSAESLRKRVLQVNQAFEVLGINASLSSRKYHYELTFDETLLLKHSNLEEIALEIAGQSNPDDYQAPEATPPHNLRKVFVSHKWIDKNAMRLTEEFIVELEQQLRASNDDSLQIKLFCDLSDTHGFNHHEEQIKQQDQHCNEADLLLMLWSLGYEKSSACRQERNFFLDSEGNSLPNKSAIVILEHGRFEDISAYLKKRILFAYPRRSEKSLIEFWEAAGVADKHNYVASLRDAIRTAFLTPLPSSRLPVDPAENLLKANRVAITSGSTHEHYQDNELQEPHAFNENSRHSEKRIQIIPHLMQWAGRPCTDNETSRVTVLLGDFGFGKTVTCRLLAQHLGERYEKDKQVPLPIYLDLKALLIDLGHNLQAPIEHLLETMLAQTGQASISGQEVIQYVRQKPCLLIFDGFDEIGQKLNRAQQQRIYQKLLDVIPAAVYRDDNQRLSEKKFTPTTHFPSKILISCRTHFFNHFQQETSFFIGNERHTISENNAQRFYMAPFRQEAIQAYLSSALGAEEGEKAFNILGEIHDLSELSSHPIMLKLICRHIPELKQISDAGSKVNSATLYLKLFDQIGERDIEKHLIQLSDKQALLGELALTMWLKGTTTISFRRLEEWFKHFSSTHPLLQRQISVSGEFGKLVTDLCNATLLVRNENDEYRLAHTSYLEFFRAVGLFEAIKKHQLSVHIEANKALNKSETLDLNPETLQFLFNWWEIADQEDKADFSEGFLRLLGRPENQLERKISYSCWVFCQLEAVHTGMAFPHSIAPDWSGLSFTEMFVPSELNHLSLKQANLSDCYFHLIRFNQLQLSNVDFSRSKLYQCYFHQCRLENCIWESLEASCTGLLSQTGLDSKGNNRLKRQKPHAEGIDAVTFSPDGRQIVSGSNDETIKLWETATGHCLRTFEGHTGGVNSVAFSPDGRHILSGSDDEAIKLWEADTGHCLHTFEGHEDRVTSIAFSPDGRHILSGSSDHTAKLWEVATEQCLYTFEGHTGTVNSVAFSPDGLHILSGSRDQTIKLWEVTIGQCSHTFDDHGGIVTSVAFSPDGRHILSGSFDRTFKLWEVGTGKCLHTFEGHGGIVTSAAFSPDGLRILSASFDRTIKLWEVATGQCQHTFEGHTAWVTSVAFSPDEQHILSSSYPAVKLWDAATGHCLHTIGDQTGMVGCIASSPDGLHILSASYDRAIKHWDTMTGQCLPFIEPQTGMVSSIAFSPNGLYILLGCLDNNAIKYLDAATGQCLHSFEGHTDRIRSVSFAPDGLLFLSGSDDKTVKLWDIATGHCLHTLEGHADGVISVSFSPDGLSFLSGSYDRTVKIWDTTTGQCQHTLGSQVDSNVVVFFNSPFELSSAVAFSPNGQRIVSSIDDKTVKIWDTTTGQCLRTIEGHTSDVNSVAFSSDGLRIVSGGYDKSIRIWDSLSGECIRTIKTADRVDDIKLSANGEQLCAALGNKICLYNLSSGIPELTIALTKQGHYRYRTSTDGQETIEYATGDAWLHLYSQGADASSTVHPACEAEHWDTIYEP